MILKSKQCKKCGEAGGPKLSDPDFFWTKVSKIEGGCWEWRGATSAAGYGKLVYTPNKQKRKLGVVQKGRGISSHLFLWREILKREIPEGMELHHKWLNKRCCNPTHLELLTYSEHARLHRLSEPKKTHCKRGHEFTLENTRFHSNAHRENIRVCVQCKRERSRLYRLTNLEAERERQRLQKRRKYRLEMVLAVNDLARGKQVYDAQKESAIRFAVGGLPGRKESLHSLMRIFLTVCPTKRHGFRVYSGTL